MLALSIQFMVYSQNDQTTEKSLHLKIKMEGIQKATGKMRIALYNSKSAFVNNKPYKTKVVTVVQNKLTVTFDHLPYGTYAVLCFQDLNSNNKLDFTGYMPDEPWGLSNNITHMGPPTWEDARFELRKNKNLDIQLF